MFKNIWFYCFVQILLNYAAFSAASPIIGKSYKARFDRYPFVVSLSDFNNIVDIDNHFCGGTLISKRHVLTSAHCIRAVDKDDVMVIVKTLDFSSGQIYKIKSWITYNEWTLSRAVGAYMRNYDTIFPHPQRINNVQSANISILNNYYQLINDQEADGNICTPVVTANDIAIITLSQDVKNVDPAKISVLFHDELIGQNAVTVGWGLVNETTSTPPDTLLKVNLKILSSSEIKNKLYGLFKKKIEPEPYFYYTSADPPAVLGAGDSGGPLMLLSTKEIVGVNEGSCDIKNPQYNRFSMSRHVKFLDEYKHFINKMINQ